MHEKVKNIGDAIFGGETMRISILMSTYNGEKYLRRQMQSLVDQTRQIDEVVIVDDKSTDDTVKIANDFIRENNLSGSWKVFVNAENKGWRRNFIEGIQRTTGDILFFCDQDDIWFDDKVEIVTDVLLSHDEIQVVASKETLWSGDEIHGTAVKSDCFSLVELGIKKDNYFIACSGCTMAIRRNYINSALRYHVAGWAHDDFFWKMAITDGTFALLEETTILHRIHGNNESRKKRNLESTLVGVKTEIVVANQLLKYLNNEETKLKCLEDKRKLIKHKKEGNSVRLKFLQSKNLLLIFKLVFGYSDIYRRKRQILGDILLVYSIR